tara:strand:+ start:458 stop:1042 length:585 start_codon:yes stop_codon:yes gene_type:complete
MKSFKQSIDESSLSRVMHHVNHTPKMGILSPHRQEHSDEENERRFSELKRHVRKLGHGYVEMRGGYKEEGGFVKEKSLMIPNIERKHMLELGKKYDQHSVIHKDGNDFSLLGTNTSPGNHHGKVHAQFDHGGKSISVDSRGNKFQDLFSKLHKGKQRDQKFLLKMKDEQFTVEEKLETSMYYTKKHGDQWHEIF